MHILSYSRLFAWCILSLFLVSPLSTLASSTLTVNVATTTVSSTGDPLKDATVNLYCSFRNGRKLINATGSGVMIGDRGVILTNAHVAQFFLVAANKKRLKGGCSVRTGSPARSTYQASILYLPPQWLQNNVSKISDENPVGNNIDDFALLYVTDAINDVPSRFPTLPISVNLFGQQRNRSVTVTGYPSGNLDFDAVRTELAADAASSTIIGVKSLGTASIPDVLTLSSSRMASDGVSGGPITNSAGELLGIISTKSDSKKDPVLRGISMLYISRALYQETHQTLSSFINGDFTSLASTSRAKIDQRLIEKLEDGLLRVR